MQIAIEIVLIAILMASSYFYIKKVNKDETKYSNKKLIIYHIIMFCVLAGISIELNLIYTSNIMVHNVKLLVLIAGIVTLAWKDYYEYKIPNEVILVMIGSRVLLMVWELLVLKKDFFNEVKESVIACVLIGIFLILVHLIFKNSIGMGDIKLMMVMALYQSFYGSFSSIFFSMIVICISGIVLMAAKKKNRKDVLPFAPAVLLGTCISVAISGI